LQWFGGFDDPVDAGLGQPQLLGNAAEAVSVAPEAFNS
jgi:hypothetical protein